MSKRKVEALVLDQKGSVLILSPAVGIFRSWVRDGDSLGPGALFGDLTILDSRKRISLPPTVSGLVVTPENFQKVFPVGYKSPIFSIRSGQSPALGQSNVEIPRGEASFGKNEMIIKAFTSGIFYTRPSPDADPFVSPGSILRTGSVLGLIEVMKSFNQIIYSNETINGSGKVVKILKKDSEEVNIGDPLFVIVND